MNYKTILFWIFGIVQVIVILLILEHLIGSSSSGGLGAGTTIIPLILGLSTLGIEYLIYAKK